MIVPGSRLIRMKSSSVSRLLSRSFAASTVCRMWASMSIAGFGGGSSASAWLAERTATKTIGRFLISHLFLGTARGKGLSIDGGGHAANVGGFQDLFGVSSGGQVEHRPADLHGGHDVLRKKRPRQRKQPREPSIERGIE